MTDDPRAQLATLLATELDASELQWIKTITELERLFASKGRFQSGARIVGTSERLSEGLVQYRRYIFDKWATYVRPRLPSLSPSEQSAFVGVALAAMDQAMALALQTLETRSMPSSHKWTEFSGPINDTATRERRSLETELDLYMSTPTSFPASVVNVTTHGHSSPVNVGSGTQTQQITTAEGMGELILALTAGARAQRHVHGSRGEGPPEGQTVSRRPRVTSGTAGTWCRRNSTDRRETLVALREAELLGALYLGRDAKDALAELSSVAIAVRTSAGMLMMTATDL